MAITPSTPGAIDTPNTLTADPIGEVAIPNTLTADAVGAIAIPNTLNAEAVGAVAIPNTLNAEAYGAIAVPNTLTADAVGVVAAPNVLAPQAPSAFPRTICPLVSLDFASQLYAQCGSPVAFDDLFAYSRASSATFINRTPKCTAGYDYFVDTVLDDTLRFEYDPETGENLGALIEGSSTNLALYSEEFDNAAWTKTATTINTNTGVAPDKTSSMDEIEVSSAAATQGISTNSFTADGGSSYTFSIYILKSLSNFDVALYYRSPISGSTQYAILVFNPATGVVSTAPSNFKLVDFGDYYKVEITEPSLPAGAMRAHIRLSNMAIGSKVGAWGAQLEALPFASSYIRTEGSAVSRSADNLSLPSAGNFNASEFTLFADVKFNGSGVKVYNAFSVSDGTTNNRLQVRESSLSKLNLVYQSNGTLYANTQGANIPKETTGVTVTYDGISVSTYLDGSFGLSSSAVPLENENIIVLGNLPLTSDYLYGHISKFASYDINLTAQEVSLL